MNDHRSLIDKVNSGAFTERELVNLYRNAHDRGATIVVEAVRIRLASAFPRAAKKLLAPRTNSHNGTLPPYWRESAKSSIFPATSSAATSKPVAT